MTDEQKKVIEEFDKHVKQVQERTGNLVFSTSFRTIDSYAHSLRAIIESLQSKPCPYIETSDEGTSYCRLAETQAKEGRVQE